MSALIKNLLFIAILATVVYAGYNFFIAGNDPNLDLGNAGSEGDILTREFLIKLNELEGIDFSNQLFNDPRFRSFTSFSTVPESVTAGRSNPFSP